MVFEECSEAEGQILLSCLVVPVHTAVLSALGVAVLNLVIAHNHRPGRYIAA